MISWRGRSRIEPRVMVNSIRTMSMLLPAVTRSAALPFVAALAHARPVHQLTYMARRPPHERQYQRSYRPVASCCSNQPAPAAMALRVRAHPALALFGYLETACRT